jgi:SET domain-containing protein
MPRQYIDATKRGGIARFANHSCAPNCYVAKWTVGAKVRMGIFARRAIRKHEELTFNYNVDRYGCASCFRPEPRAERRAGMTHSRATAASRTASASSAGRRRRTSAGWTRSTSTVRARGAPARPAC